MFVDENITHSLSTFLNKNVESLVDILIHEASLYATWIMPDGVCSGLNLTCSYLNSKLPLEQSECQMNNTSSESREINWFCLWEFVSSLEYIKSSSLIGDSWTLSRTCCFSSLLFWVFQRIIFPSEPAERALPIPDEFSQIIELTDKLCAFVILKLQLSFE